MNATDLLIKALRPILVPLLLEALEQHARTHTTLRTFYLASNNRIAGNTWQ